MLSLAFFIFVCLSFSAKDGLDRWIYGAFSLATLAALIHYRQIPILAGWRF